MAVELSRKDLKLYYKYIEICVVCRKKYGMDKKIGRQQNKRCPACCDYVKKNWGVYP